MSAKQRKYFGRRSSRRRSRRSALYVNPPRRRSRRGGGRGLSLGGFVPPGTLILSAGAAAGLIAPGMIFKALNKNNNVGWINQPGWAFVGAKAAAVVGVAYALRRFGGKGLSALARGFLVGGLASAGLDAYTLAKAKNEAGRGVRGFIADPMDGFIADPNTGFGQLPDGSTVDEGAFQSNYVRAA